MIGKCRLLLLALFGLAAAPATSSAQATFGYEEPVVCPTPFRPATAGLTFHGRNAFRVEYYTFPGQVGSARYDAMPDPAVSEDGDATWNDPGAIVQCTTEWYFLPDGRFAYARFQWHVVRYLGIVNDIGDCGSPALDEDIPTYENGIYSPYNPPSSGGCGSGGGGVSQPEDTWVEWYEGIRFLCTRSEDRTGGNIVTCTVDNP